MCELKRLVEQRAKELKENGAPDYSKAIDYFLNIRDVTFWKTLEDMNRRLNLHILNQTLGFEVILDWILEGPPLPDQDEAIPWMTYEDKRKASRISENLEKLSNELARFFPELTKPYALLRVIKPWKHAMEPFVFGPSPKSTRGQSSSDAQNKETAVEAPKIASEKQRYYDEEIYSARELLKDCTGSWESIGRGLQEKGYYGIESSIAGPGGVLAEIQNYVQRQKDSSESVQSQRKHPLWCKPAVRELWGWMDRSLYYDKEFFENTQKHLIFEYAIYAYAHCHGLEPPAPGWGPDEINKAIA